MEVLETARTLAAAAAAAAFGCLVMGLSPSAAVWERLRRLQEGGGSGGSGEAGRTGRASAGGRPGGECWTERVKRRLPPGLASLWPLDAEAAAALAARGLGAGDVHLAGTLGALAAGLVLVSTGLVRGGVPPGWLVFGVGVLAAVGPRVWVARMTAGHRAAVARELPEVAELMTLGAESGLGLLDAVRLAASLSGGPVGRSLAMALDEVQAGRETAAALRDAAARVGGREAAAFVASVVQGLELGTPVARVLRAQADSLRTRRRQALEARIAALPLKLTLATIVFFVPALFVLSVLPNLLAFLQGRW